MNTLLDDSTFIYEENEDPRCSGCLQYIEDGSVIQFGEGIWHFECFRCAKCHKLVECYSNLLLLRDGSPICEDCSYVCHACGKAIKAEAIMTGDEAYHAECFRCAQCNIKIEDLVFTQTSKGIFCTSCHEARKQQRQRRKEERMQQQQQHLQASSQEPLRRGQDTLNKSPSLSRGNPSPRWHKPQEECSNEHTRSSPSAFKSTVADEKHNSKNLILSANELAELNQMLNHAIESNLNDDIPVLYSHSEHIPSPPKTRGSVSPSSDATFLSLNSNDHYDFDADDDVTVNDTTTRNEKYIKHLEQELAHTKNCLHEVDSKFNKIKTISRKALDEFHVVKEGYAAEVAARQEAEAQAARLKSELAIWHQTSLLGSEETTQMLKEEIARLSRSKAELEKACFDLQSMRDNLVTDICNDILSRTSVENGANDLQKSLQQQLQSFKTDIDIAKASYARLVKARDDIINEMIMLNTKNAELTSLNNDLSRRVTEREREAIAVMAGTSFLGPDEIEKEQEQRKSDENVSGEVAVSLERKSSDHQNVRKVAQRDSISKAEPPKMFKFRRNKGGNVFGRKGQGNKKNSEEMTIGLPYDATTSQPFNFTNENTKTKSSSDVKELVDVNLKNRAGHSFTQTRFLRPAKCEICADKIWRASELKCQGCGYVCHFKCMHNVSAACAGKNSMDSSRNPVEQAPKMIFGNDLAAQVQLEKGTIPLVVQKCIEAVEARGMDFEGIYRKSGAAGQMRQIQQCFEKGEAPDLSDEDKWNDICAVTSVLKQYFRDLPDPLFTYDLHPQFMEASVASADQQFAQFQKIIHLLPPENYHTLKFLMQHLDKIQRQHSENLMTARNLAVVFGPTLMRDRDESRDLVDMNRKITAIEYILNHVPALFADPSPHQQNRSSPLPTTRRNSLVRANHRRDYSTDDILRAFPPAVPPRENANYI